MVAQTRKRKAALEQAAGKAIETPPTSATSKRQKLPVRSKDDEEPAQKAAGTKGTLITFDDNGKADKDLKVSAVISKAAAPVGAAAQESEDSDDDAAPEAVSTAKAAADVKKSAQVAQKAAREQAAAEKRKRQERDTLLKKQAEGRKHAEEEAKAAAAAAAAASAAQDDDDDDDDDNEMGDGPSVKQQESATRGRKKTNRVQIPDLLPAEFLTDSSSEDDEGGDADHEIGSRPRKRKVSAVEKGLSRQDRGPRDERLGSTVYRVAQAADERLAPKAKKYSKSTKDVLLKRHRTGVKPRAGFFTRK